MPCRRRRPFRGRLSRPVRNDPRGHLLGRFRAGELSNQGRRHRSESEKSSVGWCCADRSDAVITLLAVVRRPWFATVRTAGFRPQLQFLPRAVASEPLVDDPRHNVL